MDEASVAEHTLELSEGQIQTTQQEVHVHMYMSAAVWQVHVHDSTLYMF